jgi:uncharacterized protein (TIGR03435 family)
LAVPAFAQASAGSSPTALSPKFAYDTVSVRQCKPGAMVQNRETPNGYLAKGNVLWTLMYHAYYPAILTGDQLVGLPDWASSMNFDVEAKMDDDTAAALQKLPEKEQAEQRKLMLQAILADRFQLKIHHESRERPVYDLVIAKGGPKLTELKAGENPGGAGMRSGRIDVHGLPIVAFAEALSHVVDRRVVDKTGLTGKYVITVTYRPDEANTPNQDESAPSIFTALQEQLGLKLVPAKASVEITVIDHVERPSEN